MGNQQERFYGWLAGIIDGEGSISIQCYTKPDGNIRLTPFVSIVNTSSELLEHCAMILELMRVDSKNKFLIMERKGTNRPVYQLMVSGYPAVREILTAVQPYLFLKKLQAVTLLEFMSEREKNLYSRDSLGRLKRNAYSRKEIELLELIRTLNHRKSSETIRQAPNVIW